MIRVMRPSHCCTGCLVAARAASLLDGHRFVNRIHGKTMLEWLEDRLTEYGEAPP